MTVEAAIQSIVTALAIPDDARVDARVPKKLLIEQGAPTPADKRAIQDGIDELQWIAALKPNTIGVPTYRDETRDYLEIAVVSIVFRPGAKAARLIELAHRAIPYPVLLITAQRDGTVVSVAHKRQAQNETGKVVAERMIQSPLLDASSFSQIDHAFLDSLALAKQPRCNLIAVYEGWVVRIEALTAARLSGAYSLSSDTVAIESRRAALEAHTQLMRETLCLRAQANREKQLRRRIDINLEIRRLEATLVTNKRSL